MRSKFILDRNSLLLLRFSEVFLYPTAGVKEMYNMPVTSTSTEYLNKFDREAVTLGAGYRGKVFYFDMAYVLQTQEADFYPFADPEYYNPPAEVVFTDHTVIATFGMKF